MKMTPSYIYIKISLLFSYKKICSKQHKLMVEGMGGEKKNITLIYICILNGK